MVYKEIIWNIIITSCGTKIYLGSLGRLIESRNKRLMIATCCVIKSVIEMRCLMKSVPSPCLFCNIIKLESILGNTLKMISLGSFEATIWFRWTMNYWQDLTCHKEGLNNSRILIYWRVLVKLIISWWSTGTWLLSNLN